MDIGPVSVALALDLGASNDALYSTSPDLVATEPPLALDNIVTASSGLPSPALTPAVLDADTHMVSGLERDRTSDSACARESPTSDIGQPSMNSLEPETACETLDPETASSVYTVHTEPAIPIPTRISTTPIAIPSPRTPLKLITRNCSTSLPSSPFITRRRSSTKSLVEPLKPSTTQFEHAPAYLSQLPTPHSPAMSDLTPLRERPTLVTTSGRGNSELHRRSSSRILHQRNPTPDGAGANNVRAPPKRGSKGTVAALNPAPPITIMHTANIVDACQYMSAKRTDSLLVVDSHQRLCGIMTDKDVAFKVVGDGLDPLVTKMAEIMTPSPVCVSTNTSATEALSIMVTKHFRHLPVLDDEGDVVGILDITKCLFDALTRMERMDTSSRKLTDALETFEKEFSGSTASTAGLPRYVEIMRQKMLAPSLDDVMQVEDMTCPTVSFRSNVREAARMMKETRSTAVAIVDQKTGLSGILTTKDIVLRVVASKAYPHTTSVVRVMTPRPDTVGPDNTVLEALQMMHENRYLHLPLQDEDGRVVGMADVLKLTHFVLQKVSISPHGISPNLAWHTSLVGPFEWCSVTHLCGAYLFHV